VTTEQLADLSAALCNASTVLRARAEILEAVDDIRADKTKQSVEKTHNVLETVLQECCSYMASHGLFIRPVSTAGIRELEFRGYMRLLERTLLTDQERSDFYHYNDVHVAVDSGAGVVPHPNEAIGFAHAVVSLGNRLGLWALSTKASLPTAVPVKESFGSLNLRVIERQAIIEALAECQGNQTRTAALLGVHRDTLRRKLAEFGIEKAYPPWSVNPH
jgi:transcriptional regulator with GAF, ATPase, and Fis domain